MIHVELSWPDKGLSPNARLHWAKKAKLTKAAKEEAAWATLRMKPTWIMYRPMEGAKVAMIFYPPDNRRRDLDNLIASMKGATDGISAAIGIDDSKFELDYSMGHVCKGGKVVVTISPYTL